MTDRKRSSGPLDTEYLRAVTAAELAWADAIIRQLRSGGLTWSGEELAQAAKRFLPE